MSETEFSAEDGADATRLPAAMPGQSAESGEDIWAEPPVPLDYQALLTALAAAGRLGGQDAREQESIASEWTGQSDRRSSDPATARAEQAHRAAIAVEYMEPGQALAGWLSVAADAAPDLDEDALAGLAVGARRLAAWAQATQLRAAAYITARAAVADPKIGVLDDGRPRRVCQDALGQIALAESMSAYAAEWWADLAVTLSWRLPDVGRALLAGQIDLNRARVIAEATARLDEQSARQVAAKVLPDAGRLVPGDLRDRCRRAVLAADPQGADERRKNAEASARVRLYGDDEGTATLAGYNLPGVLAAAAMARITAMARASKAAAGGGALDLHRAQVMIGLLLGSLGLIPPADGAPPDQLPPGDPGPDDPGSGPAGQDGPPPPADVPAPEDIPPPGDEDAPADDDRADVTGPENPESPADYADLDEQAGIVPDWPGLPPAIGSGEIPAAFRQPGQGQPRQADSPDGPDGPDGPDRRDRRSRPDRPVPGLLDLTVPWRTLAGQATLPGQVGRIGPVTPAVAFQLARIAAADPAARWRVIVTDPDGRAITVTHLLARRRRTTDGGPGPPRLADPGGRGLVGRVTLTIATSMIPRSPPRVWPSGTGPAGTGPAGSGSAGTGPSGTDPTDGPGLPGTADAPQARELGRMLAAALRAAARAAGHAARVTDADAAAGGCAHVGASRSYRPPARLREYIVARDVTCRSPVCRRPAWMTDLDHTIPWDDGGPTCHCNLGARCRRDHQLKQHPRWRLRQDRPGWFSWTTPAGRTYVKGPDIHPV